MCPPDTDATTRAGITDSNTYNARDYDVAGDGVTNDVPALQALVDRLGAAVVDDGQPRVIYCPAGAYLIESTGVVWRSGVSLVGAGMHATRFVLNNNGNQIEAVPLAWFTEREHDAGPDNNLADCTFSDFEIDGSRVDLRAYNPLAKGLGLQYVVRGHFHHLYIHDTVGTGFGCDFLQSCLVDNILAVRCGRLDDGTQMGGAGIGIGVGGWTVLEPTTIVACTVAGNGTNGIFVELQKHMWPPAEGIRIIGCHAVDNRYGISDWGADGLIVNSCTMISNHDAGFNVSSNGTASVAGRGGLVTSCVIDRNIRDGLEIGDTPGPYMFSANRISRNGRCGYWQHNTATGWSEPTGNIVLDHNEIWGNGLAGICLAADMVDPALRDNRIRDNGVQCAPPESGSGYTVSYTERTLTDTAANWPSSGHVGKCLTVDGQRATVTANTATELTLAPFRPGATTAWADRTPPAGTAYHLPDPPDERPGITLGAIIEHPGIHGNRVWDRREPKRQTHGVWITDVGSCREAWATENDLDGNAGGAVRFDTTPEGGRWHHNAGIRDRDPGSPGRPVSI